MTVLALAATAAYVLTHGDRPTHEPQAASSGPSSSASPAPDRAKPVRTLAGHTDPVVDIAFSADGHTMATGSEDKTIRLWDLAAPGGQPIRVLAGHEEGVAAVAFSPDGHQLASAGGEGTIRLWNVAAPDAGGPLKITAHEGGVAAIAYVNDKALVSSGYDGLVQVWNLGTRKSTKKLNIDDVAAVLAPSPDGSTVMVGTSDAVHVRNVAAGTKGPAVASSAEIFEHLTIGRDRRHIASCSSGEPSARLFDAETHRQTGKFGLDANGIYGVALSADGQTIATGLSSGPIKLWKVTDTDPASATAVRTLENPVTVTAIAFSPDGRYLVAASIDDSVRLFDVSDLR